ncbi:MAG: D-glycerate dehydrogenase, partial [Alphaproteobacteria bacterium]|nr:D-glycerate dehydrogenase [Alphaproteobacteria bacterium]
MKRPKIFATRRFPKSVEERLHRNFEVILNEADLPLSASDIIDLSKDCDGMMVSPTEAITAEVIENLSPTIKIISTFSVGFDHIDIEAAHKKKLIVTNTPDVLTDATADIAMLCLLGA